MAGRTNFMADKALNLYRGLVATPIDEMWISLFTTSPTADHQTAHGGIEWGPPRMRIFPNSAAGSPSWSQPSDVDVFTRKIVSEGSMQWLSISLTTSPSTVVAFGMWNAETSGLLLTWGTLDTNIVVTDGEDRVFGTNDLKIQGD